MMRSTFAVQQEMTNEDMDRQDGLAASGHRMAQMPKTEVDHSVMLVLLVCAGTLINGDGILRWLPVYTNSPPLMPNRKRCMQDDE